MGREVGTLINFMGKQRRADDQALKSSRDKKWEAVVIFFFSFVNWFTHQKHLTKSICMRGSLAKKRG